MLHVILNQKKAWFLKEKVTIQFYNDVTNNQHFDFPYLSLTTSMANKKAIKQEKEAISHVKN